jgi:hypothetical protein
MSTRRIVLIYEMSLALCDRRKQWVGGGGDG